jgi:hypothetical protein
LKNVLAPSAILLPGLAHFLPCAAILRPLPADLALLAALVGAGLAPSEQAIAPEIGRLASPQTRPVFLQYAVRTHTRSAPPLFSGVNSAHDSSGLEHLEFLSLYSSEESFSQHSYRLLHLSICSISAAASSCFLVHLSVAAPLE